MALGSIPGPETKCHEAHGMGRKKSETNKHACIFTYIHKHANIPVCYHLFTYMHELAHIFNDTSIFLWTHSYLEKTHQFIFQHRHCYMTGPKMVSLYVFTTSWNPLAKKPASTKLNFHTFSCFKYWLAQTVCLDFSLTSYGKTQKSILANPKYSR